MEQNFISLWFKGMMIQKTEDNISKKTKLLSCQPKVTSNVMFYLQSY